MCGEITSFESEYLRDLQQGIVYASVPVVDNCLQVNNRRESVKSRLLIVKDEISVSMSRFDGLPVQAEINDREKYIPGQQNDFKPFQVKVFSAPLPSVTFVKTNLADENCLRWFTLEDPNNQYPERIQEFAYRLGYYAKLKQKSARMVHSVTPAIVASPSAGGTYAEAA